jgi:putative aldouronate transport system substrate-binding protein
MDSDFISVAYDPMGSYLTGLVSSSAVGVWCTSGEGLGNIEVPISCVPNLTVEEGGIDHLTSTSLLTDSTNTYITSCCEDVELAMRFCDYLYSEDGILFYNYGFEGEDYTIDENGQPQFTDAVINNEYGVDVSNYMRIRAPYTLCSSMMLRYRTAAYNTDIANEAWDVWSSNLDGTMFIPSNVSMNNEETETSSYYVADIVTYASQMIPQFITGDADLGDWDSFVASLKDMNIETCIAAEQSAYDRCME